MFYGFRLLLKARRFERDMNLSNDTGMALQLRLKNVAKNARAKKLDIDQALVMLITDLIVEFEKAGVLKEMKINEPKLHRELFVCYSYCVELLKRDSDRYGKSFVVGDSSGTPFS